uniref:Uncharacterized protein n=1 Tax=Mycobacterium riyadhense TaxID=486698 RepID=A0A653ELQ2_9MYCO|nr:hypothetical protein BIN_B_02123 [Mycobacterium riyadhense]
MRLARDDQILVVPRVCQDGPKQPANHPSLLGTRGASAAASGGESGGDGILDDWLFEAVAIDDGLAACVGDHPPDLRARSPSGKIWIDSPCDSSASRRSYDASGASSLGCRLDRWLRTALPGGTKALGLIGFTYDGNLSIMVVADRSLMPVADRLCTTMQDWFDDLAKAVAAQGCALLAV